jgi:hypothetical protein
MAIRFNPLTGNFDFTGSGGSGGSSYIDGEVAVYTDLPLDGTAAINTAWLVREASGAWLLARKPAGIYIRSATAGVSRDADYTYAGILPDVFNDANFLLYDNGDSSKNLAFQLSGITTGTTRTLTVPDASGTIARTETFAAPPAIGNTTPAAGTFTTLTANNGTLTASAPAFLVEQTLNGTTATVFSLAEFKVNNTASSTNSSILQCFDGANSILNVRRNGITTATSGIFSFNGFRAFGNGNSGGQVILTSNGSYNFTNSTTSTFGTIDVVLRRDAAGVLAQYDGANAQESRIYNTFTSATNFERLNLRWASNEFILDAEAGSAGGTLRGIKIGSATSSLLGFYGATPVDQPATVSDPSGVTTDEDVEARTAINAIIDRLQELGLIA